MTPRWLTGLELRRIISSSRLGPGTQKPWIGWRVAFRSRDRTPFSISALLPILITTTAREAASRAILGGGAWTTRLGIRIPHGIHRSERGAVRPVDLTQLWDL